MPPVYQLDRSEVESVSDKILDLFRCESVVVRTHWVLVVMDQRTRRIVGFGGIARTQLLKPVESQTNMVFEKRSLDFDVQASIPQATAPARTLVTRGRAWELGTLGRAFSRAFATGAPVL